MHSVSLLLVLEGIHSCGKETDVPKNLKLMECCRFDALTSNPGEKAYGGPCIQQADNLENLIAGRIVIYTLS